MCVLNFASFFIKICKIKYTRKNLKIQKSRNLAYCLHLSEFLVLVPFLKNTKLKNREIEYTRNRWHDTSKSFSRSERFMNSIFHSGRVVHVRYDKANNWLSSVKIRKWFNMCLLVSVFSIRLEIQKNCSCTNYRIKR